MHKLTGKQCREARQLLKWNLHDVSAHVNAIHFRRIESFERGMVHIAEWENHELVQAFRKEGVLFSDDLDVRLDTDRRPSTQGQKSGGEGAHISLDADQSILSDSTEKLLPAGGAASEESEGNPEN